MQYATLAPKALTALLTARLWKLRLERISSTPVLSLRLAEAVTYRILEDRRCRPYKQIFQERQRRFFLWKQKDWEYVVSCEQECDEDPLSLPITCYW
jgi:hypothetical protein